MDVVTFTLQHALDCKTGGLVIQRHNEVWDCLGDMAAQVWSQVVREPIVKEAESKADGPGLRADLGIRGVWTPQVEALFDIKAIDTDAPSHLHRTPESILDTGALEKKKLYKKAVEDRRGTFTPFVTYVDGLLHREAEHFLKQGKIICRNVCIRQSSTFICPGSSIKLMSKRIYGKVEEWTRL